MERYASALLSNNVEALAALYAPNGVFMREDMPAVVGRDALRAAYRQVFATLKVELDLERQDQGPGDRRGIVQFVRRAGGVPPRAGRVADPQLHVCFESARRRDTEVAPKERGEGNDEVSGADRSAAGGCVLASGSWARGAAHGHHQGPATGHPERALLCRCRSRPDGRGRPARVSP
jgi:hypothetical protein